MELLDVYDENHNRLNLTVDRNGPRDLKEGQRLLVCHLCIFDAKNRMLAQQRQSFKKLYPGAFDLSAGGFVQAGETSVEAIRRECAEELGLILAPGEPFFWKAIPFSYIFDDIYLLRKNVPLSALSLQKEEVSAAAWMTEEEILTGIDAGSFVDYEKSLVSEIFHAAKAL